MNNDIVDTLTEYGKLNYPHSTDPFLCGVLKYIGVDPKTVLANSNAITEEGYMSLIRTSGKHRPIINELGYVAQGLTEFTDEQKRKLKAITDAVGKERIYGHG